MKYLEYGFFILLIFALTLVGFFIDPEVLENFVVSAGVWAPISYILAKISVVVFAPLSGIALYVLSVPLFGFWKGLLFSFIGDFIGATITFYISRIFGRSLVEKFIGKKSMPYIERALETMSTVKGFLSIRIALIAAPEVASYAGGFTKISFPVFITIHMLVDLVPIIVMTLPGVFLNSDQTGWVSISLLGIGAFVAGVGLLYFIHLTKKTKLKTGK